MKGFGSTSFGKKMVSTAVNVVPGCPGINMYIPEFPGMEKGVPE